MSSCSPVSGVQEGPARWGVNVPITLAGSEDEALLEATWTRLLLSTGPQTCSGDRAWFWPDPTWATGSSLSHLCTPRTSAPLT